MADGTWEAMSLERLRAAKALLDLGFYRDSLSRSYYAAYCAATSRVVGRNVAFAFGRQNPSHDQLDDGGVRAGDRADVRSVGIAGLAISIFRRVLVAEQDVGFGQREQVVEQRDRLFRCFGINQFLACRHDHFRH